MDGTTIMSHNFLKECHSTPLTLRDLKPGDKFIVFPDDGDDNGHGGFKGGGVLHVKIEPYHPGERYVESFLYTCRAFDHPERLSSLPLSVPILKVVGVP